MAALSGQRSFDRGISAQRMRPARFTESAQKRSVACLQKDQARRHHPLDRLQNCRQSIELRALANIDNEGRTGYFSGLQRQFCESWDEIHRQVVDAVVAEIFERLQRRSLASP